MTILKRSLSSVYLAIAAFLGGSAVAAGAFASHALRGSLSVRSLEVFETATRYQMYHALALLAIALLASRATPPGPWLKTSGVSMVLGVLLFSGSLYTLSLTGINWLGAITPLGGLGLLIGWGCLMVAALIEVAVPD